MHDTTHSQAIKKPNQRRQKIRRSASEWRSIISDYKSSGLTQHTFCQQHGIAYSSFTTWLTKLNISKPALPAENTAPLFVEVTADKPLLNSSVSEWDVELAFANGTVLRLKQR